MIDIFHIYLTCHHHHNLTEGGGGAKPVFPSPHSLSQLAQPHPTGRSTSPGAARWWWSSPWEGRVGASSASCKWSHHCVNFSCFPPATVSFSDSGTSSEGGSIGHPPSTAQVLTLLHLQPATPSKVQSVLPQTSIFDPSDGSQAKTAN